MSEQTLLLIEDSSDIHELVRIWLADQPVRIEGLSGGLDALDTTRRMQPDLILLDVDLPDVDGFEICRRLKADPLTQDIPVVFLTGASTGEEKLRGLELGATDYVTKPFDPAELRARVRSALNTKRLMDLLVFQAHHDPMTGAANRILFNQRLRNTFTSATPSAVLLIDVDHFKQINDNFGHQIGDVVLCEVSRRLGDCLGPTDLLARIGGDEFAAVLTPLDGPARASAVARAMVAQFRTPIVAAARRVAASVSIGSAAQPIDAQNVDTLLMRADAALYHVKALGRNGTFDYASLPAAA